MMNETTRKQAKELSSLVASECRDMADVQSLLKELFKDTVETMLEGEMDEHLGYKKHSAWERTAGTRETATARRR